MIRPIDIGSSTIRKEIPFYLLITLVLFGFLNETWMDSSVSFGLNRWEAITFLVLLVAFIRYTFSLRRDYTPDLVSSDVKALTPGWSAVYLLGGALTLGVGGELTVRGAVAMAEGFGISEAFIGLTVIAVGTSLPELVTSVQAVRKGKFDIAVGNIIGSCVMNILFVLGLCGLLNHIPFVRFLNTDIAISFLGGLMLMMFMATGKRHRLDRWEAVLFLVSYVVYMV
ncbi:sodium:calcium antiporter [PVC group bacterium]|nr:sodium:calcium antiporter [PVC group bacterium]